MTTLRSPGAQQRQLTGAQVAREIMKSEGVDVVFGYPGGAILPMYDALHGSDHGISCAVTSRVLR